MVFKAIAGFFASQRRIRLLVIGILVLVALIDFFSLGLARRTFGFYNVDNGLIYVEDRMLKHSRFTGTKSREEDIIRYTEETLLGPVSPGLLPLFPRGTKLKTLMFRDGVVYIDFTESGALPPMEGGNTQDNFRIFHDSLLRNFSYVKDVRFFIEGNSAFTAGLEAEIEDIWLAEPNGDNFPEI